MIKHVKLYQIHGGRIDYNGEKLRRSFGSAVLNSTIPEFIDIGVRHVNIHFEANEFIYARPYTIEKVFPVRKAQGSKHEDIERRAYRLSFNNPHKNETLFSSVICLSNCQNVVLTLYRLFRWLSVKENLLRLANIFHHHALTMLL